MKGQRWEECRRCGAEPVCNECDLCEKHCRCPQGESDAAQILAFEQEYPGLLAELAKHYEQGTQEHNIERS